ncbi:MAG: hypothetical protein GXY48_04665 [Methanomicrobiales archaeon]|nr:hypothetical protein [Methanomicrobiales archaeon]
MSNSYSGPNFLAIVLLFLLLLLIIPVCTATVFLKDGTDISTTNLLETIKNDIKTESDYPFPIVFFYTTSCGSCSAAYQYLKSYERKNSGIQIEYLNIAHNSKNKQLFTKLKNDFQKQKISYPAVFIGNIGITGSSDIIHHTDIIVKAYQ